MSGLTILDIEVQGRRRDVRIVDGVIEAICSPSGAARARGDSFDGSGGVLIPGLHDHHIHLFSLAAAWKSAPAGPPTVTDRPTLAASLRAHDRRLAPGAWLRAIGYHDSVAGELDRHAIDALLPSRPVRIQHRSGALWTLNSAGVRALELERSTEPGVERDAAGLATGRIFGADWLLRATAAQDSLDLAAVGSRLASWGVTGVTDATPYESVAELRTLAAAVQSLPQAVIATGGPSLAGARFPASLGRGPVKLVVADHRLPLMGELEDWIRAAHAHGRPIAVHCVTRAALVLILAALRAAGARPGDRIEHGAVIPDELVGELAGRQLTVVTQPHFVHERGETYLAEVDEVDVPFLYRCESLLAHGVPVAAGTDAPFGDGDPWRAIAAAIARRTASGRLLGPGERLSGARALALFLGPPDAPGGPPRTVHAGADADLCLLDGSLGDVLGDPHSERVRATIRRGAVVWRRG